MAKKKIETTENVVENEIITVEEYSILKEKFDRVGSVTNSIKGLLKNTVLNYLKIGFLLSNITDEFLQSLGCENIYEYAKANFDLGVTTTRNFINIYKRFGKITSHDFYNSLELMVYASIELKDEFKDYSMSQLVELLPVSDEELNKYTPDLSIKEIRAFKKMNQTSDYEQKEYIKWQIDLKLFHEKVLPELEKRNIKSNFKEDKFQFTSNVYSFKLSYKDKKINVTFELDLRKDFCKILIVGIKSEHYYPPEHTIYYSVDKIGDSANLFVNWIFENCNDYDKFLKNKSKEKKDKVQDLISSIHEEMETKTYTLNELFLGKFYDLAKMSGDGGYLAKAFNYLNSISSIPHILFASRFVIEDLDKYRFVLKCDVDENIYFEIRCSYDCYFQFVSNYNNVVLRFKDLINLFPNHLSDYNLFLSDGGSSLFSIYYDLALEWGKMKQQEYLESQELEAISDIDNEDVED